MFMHIVENKTYGNRAFTKRCYLFPISQEELDRVKCTQNYGW